MPLPLLGPSTIFAPPPCGLPRLACLWGGLVGLGQAGDLRQAGFSEGVLAAVQCVTHRKDEPYADYVVRCKGNEVARRVKLADLGDNARLDRTILRPQRLQQDLARIRRYALSYKFLTDQISEEQYRALMAEGR